MITAIKWSIFLEDHCGFLTPKGRRSGNLDARALYQEEASCVLRLGLGCLLFSYIMFSRALAYVRCKLTAR